MFSVNINIFIFNFMGNVCSFYPNKVENFTKKSKNSEISEDFPNYNDSDKSSDSESSSSSDSASHSSNSQDISNSNMNSSSN